MPSARRALLVAAVLAWLLGVAWLAAGEAQVRALPPSDYRTGAPLPYDNLPGMPTGGGVPGQQGSGIGDWGLGIGDRRGSRTSPAHPLTPSPPHPFTPVSYDAPGSAGASPSRDRQSADATIYPALPVRWTDCWTWQILPAGLMYKSYLAGGKEPRFASVWNYERSHGWLWDATLGGRVGLVRLGTSDDFWPEGWQLDVEGAAFPRMSLEWDRDVVSADYRVGVPLTTRQGPWEAKFAYYHLSSHLADEYLERFPSATRINYVRDCIVLGVAFWPCPNVRLYSEAGWAFNTDGGSKPWEFQFGVDASPQQPTGFLGGPFFAINGRVRQEVDYGGNVTVQAGWAWRGKNGQLARFGMHYFNGMSDQYQFLNNYEDQIGVGMWYDY